MSSQNNLQAPFNSMAQQSSTFPNQQQPMMSQSQPMMAQQSNMNPQMMSQGNTQSNPLMSRGQMPPPSSYRRSPSTGINLTIWARVLPLLVGTGRPNHHSAYKSVNFDQEIIQKPS
jgi:hypothetical protein